jgi:hypothetical protein
LLVLYFIVFSTVNCFFGLILCLAENTLIGFVMDAQLFLLPYTHTHAHTHTQSYSACLRNFFVISINVIGAVKGLGETELGLV